MGSNSNSITYPLDYIGRAIYIVLPLYYFIYFITTIKFITIMIYFFNSSRKADKLSHPITVCAQSESRAIILAARNFIKNGLKGEPKLLAI